MLYMSKYIYWYGQQQETQSNLPPAERPTFNDLQNNAEAGVVKRGIGRYLFSRNPERSVKMYTYMGMPLLRKAIMGTYGRLMPRSGGSNYRTNPNKTMIERSTRFAVGGSVFNEGVHTVGAIWHIPALIDNIAEGHSPTVSAFKVGINTALVGLQRYNRARMTQRIDEELEAGRTFDPDYKNWLGIDGRAVENHEAALTAQAPEQPFESTPAPAHIAPQPVTAPPVH